jgi:hypothetical protein
MIQARRNFMKYSSIVLGMVSFGSLSLQAEPKTVVDDIEDHMGEHFDPDGWL